MGEGVQGVVPALISNRLIKTAPHFFKTFVLVLYSLSEGQETVYNPGNDKLWSQKYLS